MNVIVSNRCMCSDKQRIKCTKKNHKPFAQPCRY